MDEEDVGVPVSALAGQDGEEAENAAKAGLLQIFAPPIVQALKDDAEAMALLFGSDYTETMDVESSLPTLILQPQSSGAFQTILGKLETVSPALARSLGMDGLGEGAVKKLEGTAVFAADLLDYGDAQAILSQLPQTFTEPLAQETGFNLMRGVIRSLPSLGSDWYPMWLKALNSCPDNATIRDFIAPDAEAQLSAHEEEEKAKEKEQWEKNGIQGGFQLADDMEAQAWADIRKRKPRNALEPTPEEDELGKSVVEYTLRPYQNELALLPLRGKNTVLVAPTGSGKTIVAAHIIREHLLRRAEESLPSKVIFLAPTVPLAEQQCTALRACLRDKWRVGVLTGGGTRAPKGRLLQLRDVLVLTPAVLLNLLETGSPADRVCIPDISLLVFDECHHCDEKHPYMGVMEHYLAIKLKQLEEHPDKPITGLPQVVGMTASLGGGRDGSVSELKAALYHAYRIAANLDAHAVRTVFEELDSLYQEVPRPDDVLEAVAPDYREKPFYIFVTAAMSKIDVEFDARFGPMVNHLKLPALEGLKGYVGKEDREGEEYGQHLSSILARLPTLPESSAGKRDLISMAQHLKMYQSALELQSQLPANVAFDFLSAKMAAAPSTSTKEIQLHTIWQEVEKQQRACPDKIQANSLVSKLFDILRHELVTTDPSGQAIIFVRTRELARNLQSVLLAQDVLKVLRPCVLTSANTKSEKGGQTEEEQKTSLRLFREGVCRCLVATSVGEEGLDIPACSLVIKYNHVSSEKAMIQKRGRGRAEEAKSVLLIQARDLGQRELANKRRERAAQVALQIIRDAGLRDLARKVEKIQVGDAENRRLDSLQLQRRQAALGNKKYNLLCRKCDTELCGSENVRKLHAHYVVVDASIWERIHIEPGEAKAHYDITVAARGKCMRCQEPVGTIVAYRGVFLPTLKADSVVVVDRDNPAERKHHKQWKEITQTKFVVGKAGEAELTRMYAALKAASSQLAEDLDAAVAAAEEEAAGFPGLMEEDGEMSGITGSFA